MRTEHLRDRGGHGPPERVRSAGGRRAQCEKGRCPGAGLPAGLTLETWQAGKRREGGSESGVSGKRAPRQQRGTRDERLRVSNPAGRSTSRGAGDPPLTRGSPAAPWGRCGRVRRSEWGPGAETGRAASSRGVLIIGERERASEVGTVSEGRFPRRRGSLDGAFGNSGRRPRGGRGCGWGAGRVGE